MTKEELKALGVTDEAADKIVEDYGKNYVSKAQINAAAQVICVLADALDLTIDIDRVMTHAEAADNEDGLNTHEDYGPNSTCERWDLWVLRNGEEPGAGGNQLRGNANWYRAYGNLQNI
jgi:hypothetical protein